MKGPADDPEVSSQENHYEEMSVSKIMPAEGTIASRHDTTPNMCRNRRAAPFAVLRNTSRRSQEAPANEYGPDLPPLRSQPRNAFPGAYDARRRHLRTCDFLDLSDRTGSVVDKYALAEPEIDDILLARKLLRQRRCREQPQSEAGGQGAFEIEDVAIAGHSGVPS